MKLALFSLIFVSFAALAGAFPYDQYSPVEITDLMSSADEGAASNKIPLEKRRLYLPAVRHSSVVEYTGDFREIPAGHKDFLGDLVKSMPFIPQEQIDSYTREILIKSGKDEIWALIQGSVFPYLEEELKVGDKFKIYYFWFGAIQKDHMFAINEFSALATQ